MTIDSILKDRIQGFITRHYKIDDDFVININTDDHLTQRN